MADGAPALFHRGRSQGGVADHITHRVDVRMRGLAVLVDLEETAVVGFEADVLETDVLGVAVATEAIQQHVRLELSARVGAASHVRVLAADSLDRSLGVAVDRVDARAGQRSRQEPRQSPGRSRAATGLGCPPG